MTVVLFPFCGLLDFCCPKIPFYWETISHLIFLDRVFFYFKQFLNKILYFKKNTLPFHARRLGQVWKPCTAHCVLKASRLLLLGLLEFFHQHA
jgi:hypothetical protein